MMKIWRNGDLVPAAAATIDPADRGFLLADGVFETLLAVDEQPVWPKAHIERLFYGAGSLGIPAPFPQPAVLAACRDTLTANKATGRFVLRITLTRGPGPRGLAPPTEDMSPDMSPTLIITATAASAPPPPPSLITARTARNDKSPASQLKTLGYIDNIIARREAGAAGAQDALMLNSSGHLACASAANVFVWTGNELLTPPCRDGCLPGIARRHFMAVARKSGLECRETSVPEAVLEDCPAVVLTNSLIGAVFAARHNGRILTQPAPVAAAVRTFQAMLPRF